MTHLVTRLFLAGCNVPSDDADSEQAITPENVIGALTAAPTVTPTIIPTRTAIPRQVPTSINAPTGTQAINWTIP